MRYRDKRVKRKNGTRGTKRDEERRRKIETREWRDKGPGMGDQRDKGTQGTPDD